MNGQPAVSASAPGKMIILGEHSVVYGKPAVALAINRRFYCRVSRSGEMILNGRRVPAFVHPHISSVINDNGLSGISMDAGTQIPTSSGLGSSAALSSSLSLAVRKLLGRDTDQESVAKDAFNAEWNAQGRASPIDTSTCTHGGGVALNCPVGIGRELWRISKNDRSWNVSEFDVPEMTFVVGHTGIKAPTGPLVEKVRKYKEHNRFASDIIDEIGLVTLQGMNAIRRRDKEDLGDIMTRNHKLLSILGVSCNELNKLVNASLPYSYGAKLTGSGGGGSMIALTDQPEKVCEAISLRGGRPIVVRTGEEGVRLEDGIPESIDGI